MQKFNFESSFHAFYERGGLQCGCAAHASLPHLAALKKKTDAQSCLGTGFAWSMMDNMQFVLCCAHFPEGIIKSNDPVCQVGAHHGQDPQRQIEACAHPAPLAKRACASHVYLCAALSLTTACMHD